MSRAKSDPDPVPAALRPETAVLTRGFDPRLSVGSARPAVFRSSTYVFSSPESAERAFAVALGKDRAGADEEVDLIYARLSHPNAEILEAQLVPLEPGATGAAVFNSGMAAITAVALCLCRPGGSVIYTTPAYGGTHQLLRELLAGYGVEILPVAAGSTGELREAIADAADLRLVFIETPANPTLRMTDIAAAAEAARARPDRPVVAVDNTLMGPVFQHPLLLGADLVVYSATKYLAGFSDMLGGVVTASDAELLERLRQVRTVTGTILQADESWLLDARLATVALRMRQQSLNARQIAASLTAHPRVRSIHYPECFTDPEQKRIFEAQCSEPGALLSLDLAGGKPAAFEFLRRLSIARNAVSLGGVESLACHPRTTTHSEMSPAELDAAGIGEGLVRISVGIEDWRDLADDLRGALDAI